MHLLAIHCANVPICPLFTSYISPAIRCSKRDPVEQVRPCQLKDKAFEFCEKTDESRSIPTANELVKVTDGKAHVVAFSDFTSSLDRWCDTPATSSPVSR